MNTTRQTTREDRAELQVELRLHDALRSLAIADLKAPLLQISLSGSVIERLADLRDDRLREAVADLREAAARALSIVNAAWDDESPASVDLRVTDVAQLVEAAASAVEPLARARGVRVESGVEVDRAVCDRARTLRALVTILAVAVRRSTEGDRVEVTAARDGGATVLSVRDRGGPMDDHELASAVVLDAALPTRDAGRARRAITVQGGTLAVRPHDSGVIFEAALPSPSLTPLPPPRAPR